MNGVSPGVAAAGERGTWVVRYTAPRGGIASNGAVKLVLFGRSRWSLFQCTEPEAELVVDAPDTSLLDDDGKPQRFLTPATYVALAGSTPAALSVRNTMMTREAWVLFPTGLPENQSVEIILGDRRGGGPGARAPIAATRVQLDLHVDASGTESFLKEPESFSIDVLPGTPSKLKVTAPSCVQATTLVPLQVQVFDSFGNPCEQVSGSVVVSGDGLVETGVHAPLAGGKSSLQVTFGDAGVRWIDARLAETPGIAGHSNPIKVTAEAPAEQIWWGDPHGHSYLCDGGESPDYFFRYARDVEHLDFTALTGHDDCMLDRNYWGPLPRSPYWRNPEDAWAISKYVANQYYEPGAFVTFVAYEWSGSDELAPTGQRRFGDRNVYFPGDDGEMFTKLDERYDSPAKLCAAVGDRGGLVVPHHPGYARETGWTIYGLDWDFHDDAAEPLVEIYSKHGSSECADTEFPLAKPRADGFVRDALALGHKVGFVGGSDTHISRPGSTIQEEDNAVLRYPRAGLTAVVSATLNRSELLGALRRRACYATSGERIWLSFVVNGAPMGNDLVADADRPVDIDLEVHGAEELDVVEIISNGLILGREKPGARSFVRAFSHRQQDQSAYYYARIRQIDGACAWSSPVWVRHAGE